MENNCVGGFDAGNESCKKGHIGALCEQCDLYGVQWGDSYSNSENYICALCGDQTGNLIAFFIFFFTTLASVFSFGK